MNNLKELQARIEEEWKIMEQLGYGKIDLNGLVTALPYRLRMLTNQAISDAQDKDFSLMFDTGRKEEISRHIREDNPIFSGPMLVETLRYIIANGYSGAEDVRQDVPEESDSEYLVLLNVLGKIGSCVEIIEGIEPNQRLRDKLPPATVRKYK